jgi:ribonuclease BN (tRNA processing enzyme)
MLAAVTNRGDYIMKIKILPSSLDGSGEKQYLTTYLINGTVAIDAGCVGMYGDPKDQRRILHVFLTHCHADHISSLPIFLENVHREEEGCVILYGHSDVWQTLSRDVFNDRVWPDYSRFESKESPFVRFVGLETETAVHIEDLRITPVLVDHVVTTFGYIVEDESSVVVFGADSGPTDRIWEIARDLDRLKAAFIEVTFPRGLQELALSTGHLTPDLLKKEIAKLPEHTSIVATHIRPKYQEQIIEELKSLELRQLSIGTSSKEYVF